MKSGILKNRYYLYLTEFFSGMAVMAVELGASRLLAPYFSSSQIVWTIIIGTIMIAMALGNVFGGKWADKESDPSKLFTRIMIASVWTALIPLFGKYVIVAITGVMIVTVSTWLLVWAAFAACMLIFVFPLFLLGTVTPSLIKYSVSDLGESGRISGKLGACNTIGSIIGTFIPTFVTIPAVGTAVTFLIFAGILFILSAIYFIAEKRGRARSVISAVVLLLCCIFGHDPDFAFWEDDLTYEGESVYNYLQVRDTQYATYLSTNVMFGVQSVRMKNEGLTGMYYDYALAAPVMAGVFDDDENADILILGMGTGTYATQLKKYMPHANITGVEIDDKITDLSHKYFALPESIPTVTYDGRAYLNSDDRKYDVIMVDAYQDITIPFQMSSTEFFTLVKDHLKDDGVMVMNMNMHSDGNETDDITLYLSETVSSVFDDTVTVDVSYTTNRELFACMGGDLKQSLENNMSEVTDPELYGMLEVTNANLKDGLKGDHIFTDDKAPVELLGMRTIDTIIQGEVGQYKEVFKEKGLKGLIEAL